MANQAIIKTVFLWACIPSTGLIATVMMIRSLWAELIISTRSIEGAVTFGAAAVLAMLAVFSFQIVDEMLLRMADMRREQEQMERERELRRMRDDMAWQIFQAQLAVLDANLILYDDPDEVELVLDKEMEFLAQRNLWGGGWNWNHDDPYFRQVRYLPDELPAEAVAEEEDDDVVVVDGLQDGQVQVPFQINEVEEEEDGIENVYNVYLGIAPFPAVGVAEGPVFIPCQAHELMERIIDEEDDDDMINVVVVEDEEAGLFLTIDFGN